MLATTAETIVAWATFSALIVSVFAFGVTIILGEKQLKQLRYASVPVMMTEVHYEHTIDKICAGLALKNSGNGAAIIEAVVITYHGDKQAIVEHLSNPMWSTQFLTQLNKNGIPHPSPGSFATTYIREGAVFASGDLYWVIYKKIEPQLAVNTRNTPPGIIGFDEFLTKLSIEVRYKSLYGKRYTTELPYKADGNA